MSSGDALFRLYRATGDGAHLELLRDTVRNLAQYLPRAESAPPLEPTPHRARSETRDWLDARDDVVPTSSLFDAACMLSYTEVPGLYARTDTGFVFAFDHVEARVRERSPGRLVVSVKNPTSVDAVVRVLGESDAEAARPLAPGALLSARVVDVPAGGSTDVDFAAQR